LNKFGDNLEVNPFSFEKVPKRAKTFSGLKKKSYYLTMRDGIRIAVEVFLPKKLSPKDKLPAILLQTRYWRDYEFRIPFKWFIIFIKLE
jgi:predicted acyl esterase